MKVSPLGNQSLDGSILRHVPYHRPPLPDLVFTQSFPVAEFYLNKVIQWFHFDVMRLSDKRSSGVSPLERAGID